MLSNPWNDFPGSHSPGVTEGPMPPGAVVVAGGPGEQGFRLGDSQEARSTVAICGLLSSSPAGDGGAAGCLGAQRREGAAPAAVHPPPQGSHATVPAHPCICLPGWE